MAVAGIAFRGMRWLTGVIRAARPRMMWRHEDDWPECRAKRGQAIKEGGVSLRRAREESLRLRASGMRVPFDVISGLDEAELEVIRSTEMSRASGCVVVMYLSCRITFIVGGWRGGEGSSDCKHGHFVRSGRLNEIKTFLTQVSSKLG